jgi:hypothetical protein
MKVAAVHGIGNRFEGTDKLAAEWLPALNSGLKEAGFPRIDAKDFTLIFFGSIFRPLNETAPTRGRGNAHKTDEKDEEWVAKMLVEYNKEAASLSAENHSGNDEKGEDPRIQAPFDAPGETSRGRTPGTIQAALRQLSKSRFFKALGPDKVLVSDLAEVRKFLHNAEIKAAVLERFEREIQPGTNVVVGHSLGSVVAYESLCRRPEWKVDTFVTLGSPLGIRNLVFDALTPKPMHGVGAWPNVRRWVNISDKGDIVALEKNLKNFFGNVSDVTVYNGWHAHSVLTYLTASQTGRAIGEALTS